MIRKAHDIWWLKPIYLYLALMSLVVYAYMTPFSSYQMLYRVAAKNIDMMMLFLYIFNCFIFCLGCVLVRKEHKTYMTPTILDLQNIYNIYKWIFSLTILSYGIWFIAFAQIHGLKSFMTIFYGTFSENTNLFHEQAGRVSGLTTMTEFGVVAAPLGVWLYYKDEIKRNKIKNQLLLLLTLAILRGLLFSERLAFVELLVPMGVVWLKFQKYRKIYAFIPFIGIGGLLLFFGLFEYFRSWSNWYVNHYEGTFVQFTIDRVIGYYTIAVNTESAVIQHSTPPYFPYYLMNWFTKVPLISNFWRYDSGIGYHDLLTSYGSTEFNNPGGMLIGYKDFGVLGWLITLLMGGISTKFYYKFKNNSLSGLIMFSIIILVLLELLRHFYFSGPRGLYVLLPLIIVCIKLKKYRV